MSKLEKAYLALVTPPSGTAPPSLAAVAAAAVAGTEGIVVFDFNPKELSLQKSANWQRTPQTGASQAAMPQFGGAQPATLTLEIFLDDSESSTPMVPYQVQLLMDTVTPLSRSILSDAPSPPWVVFGWGRFMSFVAIVKSVNAKYTMFMPDGTPVRATCQITLEEVPTEPTPKQNPTSGAMTATRMHQLVDGDSLQSVAQLEYGDAARWRELAAANDIDDPMRLVPGRTLLLPAATELPELN
jgi:nucleoid-associated protein YgaU